MAGCTTSFFIVFHHGDVAEVNEIRLLCKGFPGFVTILIVSQEGFFMALLALANRGNSLKSPVLIIAMTILTTGYPVIFG